MKWLNGQSPITISGAKELAKHISLVRTGNTNRIDLYGGQVKIYRVGKVVRIEIKDSPLMGTILQPYKQDA